MKEIFELLIGKHGINDLKNNGAVVLIQLIDQVDLLKVGLILNGYICGLGIEVYDLVNGHPEIAGKALQLIDGNVAGIVLYLVIAGIRNVYFRGQLLFCLRRGVSRMKRKDSSFQCCIKDEGRPFTYATQLECVNHLKVLYSKGMVLNV